MIIIKCLCISFVITRFEPINWIMEPILKKTNNNLILLILNQMISCYKCCSFWLTLLYTQNIFYASLAFIIAYTYDKTIGVREKRIRF